MENSRRVHSCWIPRLLVKQYRGCGGKKGLTQEQLSGLAALDRTHYSKIERGLRSPTLDTIFKIAFALDMEPHELIQVIERNVAFDFIEF